MSSNLSCQVGLKPHISKHSCNFLKISSLVGVSFPFSPPCHVYHLNRFNLQVGILHMRKGRKGPRHTLSLRLNVSDDVEVFTSGMHPCSYYEASSKMHMDLGLGLS